jgi:hypothetical protein
MILDAAERFSELSDEEQQELVERGKSEESPVPAQLG